MTTPLQKTAQAVIDKFECSHPLISVAVLELRKALEDDLAPDGILSDLKATSREIEKINIHLNDLDKGGNGKTTDAKQPTVAR